MRPVPVIRTRHPMLSATRPCCGCSRNNSAAATAVPPRVATMADEEPIDYKARLQTALYALQKQQATIDRLEQARLDPIAVVGMSCRFPGADDTDALWRLMA